MSLKVEILKESTKELNEKEFAFFQLFLVRTLLLKLKSDLSDSNMTLEQYKEKIKKYEKEEQEIIKRIQKMN